MTNAPVWLAQPVTTVAWLRGAYGSVGLQGGASDRAYQARTERLCNSFMFRPNNISNA